MQEGTRLKFLNKNGIGDMLHFAKGYSNSGQNIQLARTTGFWCPEDLRMLDLHEDVYGGADVEYSAAWKDRSQLFRASSSLLGFHTQPESTSPKNLKTSCVTILEPQKTPHPVMTPSKTPTYTYNSKAP